MSFAPGSPAFAGFWGLGLRPAHYPHWHAHETPPWLEVMADNYLFHKGGPGLAHLDAFAARSRVLVHGVGLSIASADAPDARYLAELRRLCDRLRPAVVSDHLCFTRAGGRESYDLLPIPYTGRMLDHVVAHVARVQDSLGMRFSLENVSSYVCFSENTMTELEFLGELCSRTGCGLLLDVNNVYVSAANHGFDARREILKIDPAHVTQYHVAGHSEANGFLHDTHDAPVRSAVWELLALALERCGVHPVILERDDEEALAENITQEIRTGIGLA